MECDTVIDRVLVLRLSRPPPVVAERDASELQDRLPRRDDGVPAHSLDELAKQKVCV